MENDQTKFSRREFLRLPYSLLLVSENQQPTAPQQNLENTPPDKSRDYVTLEERIDVVEQVVSVHDQSINQIDYVLYKLLVYVLEKLPPQLPETGMKLYQVSTKHTFNKDSIKG